MATANARHVAYVRHGALYIEDLSPSGRDSDTPCLPLPPGSHCSVLAFSSLQPHLLAVSSGSHILVFDAAQAKLLTTLLGHGRAVTALCWSLMQEGLLVAAAIDGSVSIWDLAEGGRPEAQVCADDACTAIACSPTDPSILATIHKGQAIIFKHVSKTAMRALRNLALDRDKVISLAWHPVESGRLLTGAQSGKVYLWNLSGLIDANAGTVGDEDSDSDTEQPIFGLEEMDDSVPKSLILDLENQFVNVQWAGKNEIFAVIIRGSRHSAFLWKLHEQRATEMWSDETSQSAQAILLAKDTGCTSVVEVLSGGVRKIALPANLLAETGLQSTSNGRVPSSNGQQSFQGSKTHSNEVVAMKPISISTLRARRSSFAKTSKQLQHRRPSSERKRERLGTAVQNSGGQDLHSPPPPTSMTSSLELPKQTDRDGSPMPFLSPSIPSQKPSSEGLSPLEDDIKLAPLPRASFDSIQSTSAATQESDDSDDETYVDGMQGSASFLPGGINVPLPKACAALFAPTGELLTFFPPKPKVSLKRGDAKESEQADPKANAKKVARLFQTFGNLAGDPQQLGGDDSDSGFESTSSVSVEPGPLRLRPSFSFFPSLFPSQQSWKSRVSPTKHSFTEQSLHKVIVSLHDIDDVGSLLPASRQLASQYRILCDSEEKGADLCRHNAQTSEILGLEDVTLIWRLVTMLLEDRIPLNSISSSRSGRDILVVARTAEQLVRNEKRGPLAGNLQNDASGKLRWTTNPFGAAWIVEAVFEWAETQADVQLLATLSAILAHASQETPRDSFMLEQGLTPRLPSYQQDYFARASVDVSPRPRRLTNQPVPILRSSSNATSNAAYGSPVKPNRSSASSSRNPSQPPTPYAEPDSNTPPFSLPSLGRQGTQLSISGSASPEYHRSSFSAAAKYYAQSISDKFASYGAYSTSPPARKTGSSPSNTNEFSTSFPSGSWAKSVSFASTANPTRASLLSTSFEKVPEDESYDSDKTVEDLSQPQTPRENSECIVTLKNGRQFDDDVSGGSQGSLLSDDMTQKCRLWCDYYVEQLRCWDLLPQAAELEKVCGMTCLRKPSDITIDNEDDGVTPRLAAHGSDVCSICAIKMTGMQSFCSHCSHAAHLSCLEDFIAALAQDEQQAFCCPAGCGCACDDLPFEVAESVKEEKPKKKASFTDPRRWRARVEGDSW